MHAACTTSSPERSAAGAAPLGAAGSFNLPPDWLAMCTIAPASSLSDRSAAPPRRGAAVAPGRGRALLIMGAPPEPMGFAQVPLSPILGAPAAPVAWHAAQYCCTTCSPVCADLAAPPPDSANATSAKGLIRAPP